MPPQRRLWDSCIVVGYLAGYEQLKPDCPKIIEQAGSGQIEIVVSAIATVEVAYLDGYSDGDAEARIREFFGRNYVVTIGLDARVAMITRGLIRKYRNLKPPDAAHLATAMQWQIPIIETTDPDLLGLDKAEGTPPIVIRKPLYEGPQQLPGFNN